MSGIDPKLNVIARRGDVMARGPHGWGPVALNQLLAAESSEQFLDSLFAIIGNLAAGKKLVFQVDNHTGNFIVTVNTGAQIADRTVSLPVLAGAANFVMREAALTDNAVTRADGTTGKIQDSLLVVGDTGNVSGVVDLALTGNVTQTGATTLSTGTGTQTINGNVVVTTGKTITAVSGIIFSNETLSQYDEGTWTPTILGSVTPGTQTYSTQFGSYTRIGRYVSCIFNIALSAYDAATNGNIFIGGLPFTSNATVGQTNGGSLGLVSNVTLGVGYTQFGLRMAGGLTTVSVVQFGTAVASANITQADVGATLVLRGTISYEI